MSVTTGKYIPPSRRAGYVPTLPSKDTPPPRPSRISRDPLPDHLYSLTDLYRIFNHPQDSTFTFFSFPAPFTSRRFKEPYDPTRTPYNTPLPPSPPPPPPPHPLGHLLSYLVLFQNAHPSWNDDNQLWTHSNADKLIEDHEKDKKNMGRPLPVFKSFKGRPGELEFIGWWKIEWLEVVRPYSEELKRMMEFKEQARCFGRNGRTQFAWASSLSDTWVKVKLVQLTDQYKEPYQVDKGEGEKYVLEIGNLKEELDVLHGMREE
ncbi:uncharacterized protein IL334_002481 [Kwoniella shivajii]|uniref:Uncharacterized protein n=1 Tax=Kwoniella shivajii TaxID=564305 RepID=A0ABZ1CV79_9TREE|nr:hypothetical protein IL334_002481 [Kwoniella shivajii]